MHARSMEPGLPASSREDDHDNIVVMHGVTWAQYEAVREYRRALRDAGVTAT